MNRPIARSRIIAAFSLTCFIFLLIIVVNNYFNESKLNQLNEIYNNIRIDSLNAEVQYEILSESPCAALNFEPMSNELFELGNKLTAMEDDLGKKNQQVLNLKKYYSILEVQQWLFVKKASRQCNQNATPIAFFYSNDEDCPDCESQGFVLNYVRKTVPGVYVYSFDVNLDASVIKALRVTHNITEVPTLVIKDKSYVGYKDADAILEILNRK